MLDAITNLISAPFEAAADVAGGLIEGVGSAIGGCMEAVKDLATGSIPGVQEMGGAVCGMGSDVLQGLMSLLPGPPN
jgi:hypothetical protein